MDTNQRCGTCKHFGDRLTYDDYDENDDPIEMESKFHACNRMQHTKAPFYPCNLGSNPDPAGVRDGSNYHASLIVAEDFGCTLWEASE
jgi:hypothetical protein